MQRSMQPLHADRALSLAKPQSRGWPLRFAIASRTSVWVTGGGRQVFVPEEWLFTFAQSAANVVTVRVGRNDAELNARLRSEAQDFIAAHEGRRFRIEECVVRITPGGGGGSIGATSDMVMIVPTRVRIE
jgi:hypothetical protein